ncbi:MAG: hypothetical protein PHE38_16320 [Alishewanella agri]|nr:hypothetical protein [Alishewanella agri]
MHPNPRFYKYYWWIFTADTPVEGYEFLTDPYRLCTFTFEQQLKYCKENQISALIYNQQFYRDEQSLPFDFNKLRKNPDIIFAPAFDDDPDPITAQGFK